MLSLILGEMDHSIPPTSSPTHEKRQRERERRECEKGGGEEKERGRKRGRRETDRKPEKTCRACTVNLLTQI
jgi:hypothetical protein